MSSRRRTSLIRTLGLAALAVALATGPLTVQPVVAATPAADSGHRQAAPAAPVRPPQPLSKINVRQLLRCAWIMDISAQTLNVAAPDTHTHYWLQPYIMGPRSSIVVRGTYPFSRYISFISYTSTAVPINGVSLHDSQIAPNPGSVNPFATANAPTNPNRRQYTVRVVPKQAPFKLPNTLAGLSPGATSGLGFLLYRVYLPDRGRGPAGGVGLPTLTIDGKPRRTCSVAERTAYNRIFGPLLADAIAANAPDPADATLDPALFRKASGLSGLFTNPDNQYLYAASAPAPGRVVVIRGKAATFPNTRDGQSVTVPTQLRYWSWCSNELANPYPVVQCAADDQVRLDSNGYYTVAISMPQDRPSNATRANGVTWLAWQRPTSSGQVIPNVTYLRNMLPNSSFAEAVQNVPDPAANSTAQQQATQAKAAMGAYYPVGVYCTKTQFESQGPLNCA